MVLASAKKDLNKGQSPLQDLEVGPCSLAIPLMCLQKYSQIIPRVKLMLQHNCLNSVQKYVYTQQNP